LTGIFHHFALQAGNATQHESFVPRQNTQRLHWEILKFLGEIWTTRQKFRATYEGKECSRGFCLGFDHRLTKVDQRVSLGVVGDVFEVMT
jgi:hypothetical protein